MVPERLVGPGYPSLWPSWHDFSARKPCSPCKSMRQVFPLKASNFTIFRSVFRPTIFAPCSPRFLFISPAGCLRRRRLHTPATTRRENFPLQSRLAIRAECPPTGTKYVCTLVLATPFVSRISRYDEYFFRSNYFLISKVIIIFVRIEVSVVITDRDLNFLEMYHKILTKLFSQLCVG